MVPTSLNRLITYNLHLQFARLVQVVDHSTTSFPEGLRSPRVGDCYHTSELYLPFDNMVSTLYVVLSVLSLLCHLVLADVDGAIYRLQNSLPGKIQTEGIPPAYNPRFNAANGYSPAAMVYVSSAEDIIVALEICHDEDAPVALRSDSGHSFIGQSTVDGGIVINFMKLRDWQITMEGDRYIAKLGSGLTLLEIYSRLARHDPPLGIAAGLCPSVGIAGLASGGGYGFSSAKYGATVDRIVAAEVVVYNRDGKRFELVTATGYNEHSDLLFAVRGGMGGNYGALVSLSYDAFSINNVVSMVAFEPLVDLPVQAQSIKAFQEFMHSDAAGAEVYGNARILASIGVEYSVQCICDSDCMTCHARMDAIQAAVGLVDPLRIEQEFGKAAWFWAGCTSDSVADLYPSDGIGNSTEEELREAMTSCLASDSAVPYKGKCMFFPRIVSIEILESVLEALAQPPCDSPADCVVLIHFQGQALLEEPKNCDLSHGKCTAYDHRSPGWLFEIFTGWGRDEPAPAAKLEWIQNPYDAVFPASLGTSNQNCVDLDLAEGRKWIDQFFPNAETYRRLQQVKCRYNAVDMFNFPAIDLMTIDIDDSICEAGTTTTSTTTNADSTASSSRARTTAAGSFSTSKSTTSGHSDCKEADRKCSEGYPGSFCMTNKLPNVCRGSNVPCSCTPGQIPSSTTTRSVDEDDCSQEDLRCATLKQGSYCMYWRKPPLCMGTTESCDC